MHKVILI